MSSETSIIGRKKEIRQLDSILQSKKSEFLTVYGRRRVGKTFLVREYFNYQFDFQISGLANADTKQQLFNFDTTLHKQSKFGYYAPSANWLIAFQRLIEHLENSTEIRKKVIFLMNCLGLTRLHPIL